jgi:isocitrate/isopropylmalate dehydrogenase
MRGRHYVVACLAGAGTGPELMAEASRTLYDVSHMHGFAVDDVHVPFGTEAVARTGIPLPLSTRSAYLEADAVLVADIREPTLKEVESELDLRAAATRVRLASGTGFTLVTPLSDQLGTWAVERAFSVARSSRARLASIDESPTWRELVDGEARWHDGVIVEHLSVAEGLPAVAFQPERFDVIVTGWAFADTLLSIVTSLYGDARVVAHGRLAEHGPSIFGPVHADLPDVAGQGVVDPSSILLAVSLMLSEGLGERSAADTLADALSAARVTGPHDDARPERAVGTSTREFADAVLGLLPRANRNAEFHPGIL